MLSPRARWQKRSTTLYLSWRMLQAAVVVVYLLGSLALTGGQVAAKGSPIWGEVLPFPLFSPPGWLMLAVSVIGVLLIIPVLALARLADAGRIVGAFSATAAATAASFFFAWSQPEAIPLDTSLRWSAAFVDASVLAVLLVVAGVVAYLSDRQRARDGLPLRRDAGDDE